MQNPGGSFLCQRHRQPDTNASQIRCSSLPTDARLPKAQALLSCEDQCAAPLRESAPAPTSSAHLPTPSVISDTALISDTAPISGSIPHLARDPSAVHRSLPWASASHRSPCLPGG